MLARALIKDQTAIRLFLEMCASTEGAIKFTKDGLVSVTGTVSIQGNLYPDFYAEYVKLRRANPTLPDIPSQFMYLPFHFNKVTNAFHLRRSPFLMDLVGCPQKTKEFTIVDAPRIKNCLGAPEALTYDFTNVGIVSLEHSRLSKTLHITRCPLRNLKYAPNTLTELTIAGCASINLVADVPPVLETVDLNIGTATPIDWSLFKGVTTLRVGTKAPQPDADTLRHWVAAAIKFDVLIYDQPTDWCDPPPTIDIKKEPLWRQMLLENCMEPVDFLRVAECYYNLFGESLVPTQAVSETPTFTL